MKRGILALCSAALLLSSCGAPHRSLEKTLKGAVIDSNGEGVSPSYVLNTDYLLLYFSGRWSPSCQAFTPELVEFYQNEKGGHHKRRSIYPYHGALSHGMEVFFRTHR